MTFFPRSVGVYSGREQKKMPSKLRSETTAPQWRQIPHGFNRKPSSCSPANSTAKFDEILNQLMKIHQPTNAAEIDLVEEMVTSRWRIRRMWGIETSES